MKTPAPRPVAPAAATAPLKRALVVDDDRVICQLLDAYLGRQGWKAVLAANGEEALKSFRPGEFGLVLVDEMLGEGLRGVDVARKLLEQEPGLLVAIMTGSPTDGDKVEEEGFKLLVKPFNLKKIAALLRS